MACGGKARGGLFGAMLGIGVPSVAAGVPSVASTGGGRGVESWRGAMTGEAAAAGDVSAAGVGPG